MKDLSARFSEVERRVRALVAENHALRAQVRELTKERDAVGADARDAASLRERSALVRTRLQRLLSRLESLETGDDGTGRGAEKRSGERAGEGRK